MTGHVIFVFSLVLATCAGTGIMFVSKDVFVRLRSEGVITTGLIEETESPGDMDIFTNVMSFSFGHLSIRSPNNIDLFMSRESTFDLDTKRFQDYGGVSVEGMSMSDNMSVPGVVFTAKGMVFTEDTELTSGDTLLADVTSGDVLLSLHVTPAYDPDSGSPDSCLVCDLQTTYSIQLDVNLSHKGPPERDDVTRTFPGYKAIGFTDDTAIYIPKKVYVDGELRTADLVRTDRNNKQHLMITFPGPLRDSFVADIILNVRQTKQPPTPPTNPVVNLEAGDDAINEADDTNKKAGNEQMADDPNVSEGDEEIKVLTDDKVSEEEAEDETKVVSESDSDGGYISAAGETKREDSENSDNSEASTIGWSAAAMLMTTLLLPVYVI